MNLVDFVAKGTSLYHRSGWIRLVDAAIPMTGGGTLFLFSGWWDNDALMPTVTHLTIPYAIDHQRNGTWQFASVEVKYSWKPLIDDEDIAHYAGYRNRRYLLSHKYRQAYDMIGPADVKGGKDAIIAYAKGIIAADDRVAAEAAKIYNAPRDVGTIKLVDPVTDTVLDVLAIDARGHYVMVQNHPSMRSQADKWKYRESHETVTSFLDSLSRNELRSGLKLVDPYIQITDKGVMTIAQQVFAQ